MSENQNLEYKETWRDEYLKWICGFANADGGKLYIGIDDSGHVVGVDKAKKLSEDIPNKIQDTLGIIADVNLLTDPSTQNEYIEIVVEPYPYPINYRGQYHYRSGSTKQELKGQALNKFIIERTGKRWDGIPVPRLSIAAKPSAVFAGRLQKATGSMPKSSTIPSNTSSMISTSLTIQPAS